MIVEIVAVYEYVNTISAGGPVEKVKDHQFVSIIEEDIFCRDCLGKGICKHNRRYLCKDCVTN